MLKTMRLVAGKDLRIEARSRVATNQVLPFAVVVLVLFAFALDPDSGALRRATPGLFWLAILFCLLFTVQRAFAVETADGARDALRLSALDPAGIFLGKAVALGLELLALEVVLGVGIVVVYDAPTQGGGVLLLLASALAATCGLVAVGTLYGGLAAGLRVRDTLLPLLLLPVVAPVLIGATRAFESALGIGGRAVSEGWPWVGLLTVFSLAYTALGLVAFGPLMEEP
ncbi:MAG TPA: heme exporter protein CcmB [Acidimicrobiales bacterium]|nr:heme exporter protein CcmB [Acidimicrobiales bacterium]